LVTQGVVGTQVLSTVYTFFRHKNIGVPSKKKKKITSSQPRKLIIGIQPYLTQLDEILKNNTDWGAIKKNQIGGHKNKIKNSVNIGS
jgi:hypothetical protein